MSNLKNLLNFIFETRPKIIGAKKDINPGDRVTVLSSDLIGRLEVNLNQIYSQPSPNPNKPNGLWYAFGSEWIDLITDKENIGMSKFIRLKNEVYKIDITKANIKIIEDGKQLEEFNNKYRTTDNRIDWTMVAKDFHGIELQIEPDTFKDKYRWLSGWDIKSGCIWDLLNVKLEAVDESRREEDQLEDQINNWWWSDVFAQDWISAYTKINEIINSDLGKNNIEFLKKQILSKLTDESINDHAEIIGIEPTKFKSNLANKLILKHKDSTLYTMAKDWTEQNK